MFVVYGVCMYAVVVCCGVVMSDERMRWTRGHAVP